MKRFLSLVLSSFLILSLGTTNVKAAENNAMAIESNGNDQNVKFKTEDDMIEEMRSYGVSEETIKSLMKKYKKGEMWDSINPEYKDSAIVEDLGGGLKKYTYPDGSIRVSNADTLKINNTDNNGEISPMVYQAGYTILYQDSFATQYRAIVVESSIFFSYEYFIVFTVARGSSTGRINSYTRHSFSTTGTTLPTESMNNNIFRTSFMYTASYKGVYRNVEYWCEAAASGSNTLKFSSNH